jgi:hypothetical protein
MNTKSWLNVSILSKFREKIRKKINLALNGLIRTYIAGNRGIFSCTGCCFSVVKAQLRKIL